MTAIDTHLQDLQEILDAANRAAKENPTSANISAVEKARKALDGYQHSHGDAGERFKTQAAALAYLQRTWKIEKSKLNKDCTNGKVPRKDGFYHAKDLDYYAQADRLEPKTSAPAPQNDSSERLKAAHAEEREFRLGILRGEYINAAEEEARDAKLWAAVKNDLTNQAPAVVHELINRILPILEDDELKQRVLSLSHDLRVTYEDTVDGIFDRYAKDGGIEA